MTDATWPVLRYEEDRASLETLHLLSQVLGKVRMASGPWVNQSWGVTLSVTPRGLSTGTLHRPPRAFRLDLDLAGHALTFEDDRGGSERLGLDGLGVAAFYREAMALLDRQGVPCRIHTTPCEIEDAIPFDADETHGPADPGVARRFGRALLDAHRVFSRFRAGFRGKASPVHFFWGSSDLAATRFSGALAEPPAEVGLAHLPRWVGREAYSEELSSAGFWPGNALHPQPAFYAYVYPPSDAFAGSAVQPAGATFDAALGEFLLPYDAVRTASDPDAALLAFLESTYGAAANARGWDADRLNLGDPRRRFG